MAAASAAPNGQFCNARSLHIRLIARREADESTQSIILRQT
jgi:hypothetical protein